MGDRGTAAYVAHPAAPAMGVGAAVGVAAADGEAVEDGAGVDAVGVDHVVTVFGVVGETRIVSV